MLTTYLTCLLIGGVLVGMSALSGVDKSFDMDTDVDVDVDVDADADVDGDADVDADGDVHMGDLVIAWIPFTSMRFWTFALMAGGLTGTLLTLVGTWSVLTTAIASGGMAYVSGLSVTRLLKRLKRDEVSSSVGEDEIVGAAGQVVLPVSRGSIGQIRVRVKGRDVDVVAQPVDDDETLEINEQVLVCDLRDGVALIARLR